MCLQHSRGLNTPERKEGWKMPLPALSLWCLLPHIKNTPALFFSSSHQPWEWIPTSWGYTASGVTSEQLGSAQVTLYRLNPATWIAWGSVVRQWWATELSPPQAGQVERPLEISSVSPVNFIFNTKTFLCRRTHAETWSKLTSRRKVHAWNGNQ